MPAGFNNGTTMFADNVSFDGTDSPGKVTTDGQLLIGSTVAPNIRVGTLASGDGSVTITNGAGTIDLSVAGGSAITSVSATNASIDFIQTGTVENINFGNTNLVLGSDIIGLTSGNNNVGMGLTALNNVTSGEQNVAIGTQSLQLLTTGSANTSIGRNSQASLSNGLSNTSTGQNSLFSNSSGSNNTAYGAGALQSYQGSNNTALGYLACRDTTGTGNLGLGYISLVNCSTGTNNTGIGNGTLQLITTGSSNIAVGLNAGSSLTLNDSNEILIGTNQSAVAGESNTIRIGVTQTRAFMAGIAGISVSNQQTVVIDSTTGQLGSITGNTIQEATVTLTSAQIKSLNANPIALVPAQGAGKVIVPISIISKFFYGGTNVFVAAALQSVSVFYGTALQYISGVINNVQVVASASSYSVPSFAGIANTATSNLENVALNAYNPIPTEISGNAANDNTITFVVKYYVVTI